MSTQNPINNPTAYQGLRETLVGQVYFRDRDPRTGTTQDDYKMYNAGDRWINTVGNSSWVLVKKIYDFATSSHQAIWIGFDGQAGDMETLTPDAGGAVSATANNINVLGTAAQGISTSNAGASTLQITVQDTTTTGDKGVATFEPTQFSAVGGLVSLIPSPGTQFWYEAAGATQAMLPDEGYYATRAAGCTLTLPATCPVGSRLSIVGVNCPWILAQNAAQYVDMGGGVTTTIGVGGSISSTDNYDAIHLICVVADIGFVRIGLSGNPLIV